MEEAGFVPEADDAEKTPTTTGVDAPEAPSADKSKLTKLEQLELDLKEAIAKEDYEKAARLRDDIKKQKTPKS
jgi:protein-arginine kinase activator protein McsA